MLFMTLAEQVAQSLAKTQHLRICAALLQISNAYRSIGARLPLAFTARLYMNALNQLSYVRSQQLRFVLP